MFAATQTWAHHIRLVLERVRDWWPEVSAAAFGLAGFVAFCGLPISLRQRRHCCWACVSSSSPGSGRDPGRARCEHRWPRVVADEIESAGTTTLFIVGHNRNLDGWKQRSSQGSVQLLGPRTDPGRSLARQFWSVRAPDWPAYIGAPARDHVSSRSADCLGTRGRSDIDR